MRKIIHLDLDAFFCAVEELRNPSLAGKPFAVGGSPDSRGVVASCSYAARQFGVRSAMPTARALRLCPGLILVSGSHGDYSAVSRQVMDVLGRYTPLLEQVSIDEAYLDLSDLSQPVESLAREIQSVIDRELHLPCSLGAGSSKLIAKMANDYGKGKHRGTTPPRSITIIPAGEEKSFLAPLPVLALYGIGPKTAQRLESLGIHTIGALADTSLPYLQKLFGKYGREVWLHANGIDERPLETEHSVKSISQEVTFEKDVRDANRLEQTIKSLADEVSYRLRKEGLTAATVRLKLRWPDFSLQSRQFTLPQPTDLDGIIRSTALSLFHDLWDGERPVRLLGVGVSGLGQRAHQMALFDSQGDKERHLLQALDALRSRFGDQVVQRADRLGKRKLR